MTPDEAATGGMTMAARAVHAAADGRDEEVLSILNSGTHEEATWAAGYLVSALRSAVAELYPKKSVRASLALHRWADEVASDVFKARLALMAQGGEQHG